MARSDLHEPKSWHEAVEYAARHEHRLTPWEINFLEEIRRHEKELTANQLAIVGRIVGKIEFLNAGGIDCCMEIVARQLLGQPTQKLPKKDEWRFGARGSLKIKPKAGLWHDFESGEKGGVVELIQFKLGLDARGAAEWIERNLHNQSALKITESEPECAKRKEGKNSTTTENENTPIAQSLWREAGKFADSLGERYFLEQRKLDVRGIDLSHVLRWHSGIRAIVALMSDPITAVPLGVHRTFLDDEGYKLERKMLGTAGVIRLCPDDSVTMGLGIVEGIEDGLAVMLSGWRPIWACGSAGMMAKFPVLPGLDSLTIFADADPAGLKAAEECAPRWRDAGREVVIVPPAHGDGRG